MQVLEVNGAVAASFEPHDLSSFWNGIVKFVSARAEAATLRRRILAGEREIAQMPDHLLADIGIRRTDLSCARRRWLPDAFTVFGPDTDARFWMDAWMR
jgi:uncharacterized protein YjiS (DUF1127 family)